MNRTFPDRRFNGWLNMLVMLLASYSNCAVSQQSTSLQSTESPLQVPLVYDVLTTPHPIIQVRINGISLPFVMDTGCSFPILLDTWAAQKLHLTPTGQQVRITNANKTAQIAKVKSVEIVGKSLDTNQEGYISIMLNSATIADLGISRDFPSPSRIAGIIGVSLFGDRTVQFDFAKQTLTILLPTEQGFRAEGATTLPLKIVDKLYAVTAKSSSGTSVDLRVDTGSRWIEMRSSVAQQFQLTPTPDVLVDTWGFAGIQTCKMVSASYSSYR